MLQNNTYKLLSYVNNFVSLNKDIDLLTYSECDKKYPLSSYINFEWKNILDKPPLNSSNQTIEELCFVSNLTIDRSQKDLELIKQIDDDPTIGVQAICAKYKLKFPQKLFDNYYDATKNLIYTIKCYFNRPRPQQLADLYDIEIHVIDSATAHTASYPSGHTVYARLAANIVSKQYPFLDNNLLNSAVNQVAYARCCQGVHLPSDNKASIILANFIFDKLHKQIKG